MRWTRKTGQVAKRESPLGTAGWPEVRHGEHTEETESRVQGETGPGRGAGGRHRGRAVKPVRCAFQPDPRLEKDPAGRDGVAVRARQGDGQRDGGGDRGSTGTLI